MTQSLRKGSPTSPKKTVYLGITEPLNFHQFHQYLPWFPYKTCLRFDTSPKENSPWETYGFPWEKLCHRGRRRRLPRDLTSPKGKNKPNQHLPRNPQIKPSVRLPRDCHQTIPTSPKMINQTIFTSPKLYKPYHLYVSQGENHTISKFPKK